MIKAKRTIQISESPGQTEMIARRLAQTLGKGDTVTLFGKIGSGKTVFVKGLAQGLGIKKRILSPTFVFVRTYKINNLSFNHVDLYRLKNTELAALGLEEIFEGSITAIEWAEKLTRLPKNSTRVYMEKIDEGKRKIEIARS